MSPAIVPGSLFLTRRHISSVTGAENRAHDAGTEATTKLQKAGRTFLLRLFAEHELREAARLLRPLAD